MVPGLGDLGIGDRDSANFWVLCGEYRVYQLCHLGFLLIEALGLTIGDLRFCGSRIW